jgi:ABC-type transport system involved in multi-copper enzyme maturation permease subunit
LRASARQPFTYYLRVLGAAALLFAGLLFGLHYGFRPGLGHQLFIALHCALFVAIWVLVPMLTADCISRERREGTLGLLFLTPLKGTDIVVAKGVAPGLRAVTLGPAVLPILMIPFLMGGVSWSEALLSLLINLNAMCWALAAGLLASAWSKAWHRALLLAGILAFAFFVLSQYSVGWILVRLIRSVRPNLYDIDWQRLWAIGFCVVTMNRDFWAGYLGMGPALRVFPALGGATLFSLLVLVAAVLIAGAKTRRSWQEEPPSPQLVWLQRTFCTPVLWLVFFRRWMRRKLERNPIGWLEQRTWSGRLVTWAWFAVLVSIYSAVFTDRYFFDSANGMQKVLAWLLAGTMAASAAGSFRRERETGVLELLLVSPLGERRIISGRLGGLWSQFFPSTGLLLGVWAYSSTFLPSGGDAQAFVFFLAAFVTVPLCGLYFSLRCRTFLPAFLATMAVALVLPLVIAPVLRRLWEWWVYHKVTTSYSAWDMSPSWCAVVCQVLLAGWCWRQLHRRLTQRAFPLERSQVY